MLADIGRNLRLAKPTLELTLKKQLDKERRLAHDAYPFVPTTADVVSTSLKCALHKAVTGQRSKSLCTYIDSGLSND
jgi:hypothetical protein